MGDAAPAGTVLVQAEPGAVGVRLTWDDFDLEPFDTLDAKYSGRCLWIQ